MFLLLILLSVAVSLSKFSGVPYFPDFSSEDSPSTAGDVSEEQVHDRTLVSLADTSKIQKKRDEDQVQIAVTAKLGGIEVTVSSTQGSQVIIIAGGRFAMRKIHTRQPVSKAFWNWWNFFSFLCGSSFDLIAYLFKMDAISFQGYFAVEDVSVA